MNHAPRELKTDFPFLSLHLQDDGTNYEGKVDYA